MDFSLRNNMLLAVVGKVTTNWIEMSFVNLLGCFERSKVIAMMG